MDNACHVFTQVARITDSFTANTRMIGSARGIRPNHDHMVETYVKISKFLCWVLRHSPAKVGLGLDQNGWADISELVKCSRNHGVDLNRTILYKIVETDSKGRYEISRDLDRIRATYGHSLPIDLGLAPETPPDVLYHGTATRFLDSIMKHGITPGKRRFVHLSISPDAALDVGKRHGKPAILEIDTRKMHEEGIEFYQSSREIWITRSVPARYVRMVKNQ